MYVHIYKSLHMLYFYWMCHSCHDPALMARLVTKWLSNCASALHFHTQLIQCAVVIWTINYSICINIHCRCINNLIICMMVYYNEHTVYVVLCCCFEMSYSSKCDIIIRVLIGVKHDIKVQCWCIQLLCCSKKSYSWRSTSTGWNWGGPRAPHSSRSASADTCCHDNQEHDKTENVVLH